MSTLLIILGLGCCAATLCALVKAERSERRARQASVALGNCAHDRATLYDAHRVAARERDQSRVANERTVASIVDARELLKAEPKESIVDVARRVAGGSVVDLSARVNELELFLESAEADVCGQRGQIVALNGALAALGNVLVPDEPHDLDDLMSEAIRLKTLGDSTAHKDDDDG